MKSQLDIFSPCILYIDIRRNFSNVLLSKLIYVFVADFTYLLCYFNVK